MSDLPDVYVQSPRAVGMHFGQIMSAHVIILCKADSLVTNTSVITVSFIYPCLEDSIMVRQQ